VTLSDVQVVATVERGPDGQVGSAVTLPDVQVVATAERGLVDEGLMDRLKVQWRCLMYRL